jgi:hypothetical protein
MPASKHDPVTVPTVRELVDAVRSLAITVAKMGGDDGREHSPAGVERGLDMVEKRLEQVERLLGGGAR